jgi:hypothetical protein
MADERFIAAIGRIERAVARIENAAIAPSVAEDKDLAERHERLKSETLNAIQDLDKILADAS